MKQKQKLMFDYSAFLRINMKLKMGMLQWSNSSSDAEVQKGSLTFLVYHRSQKTFSSHIARPSFLSTFNAVCLLVSLFGIPFTVT